MNILIFGASGATGQELVRQALEWGYYVTAFVRTPSKLQIHHDHLKVVPGDVSDFTSVDHALQEKFDGVFSVLGAKTPFKRDFKLIDGVNNIVKAMETYGNERFIYQSFIGVRKEESEKLGFVFTYIVPIILKAAITDHRIKEEVIANSNLNWTIVEPPKLTTAKYTGKYSSSETIEKENAKKVTISRADLADFLLKQLHDPRYIKKRVFVAH